MPTCFVIDFNNGIASLISGDSFLLPAANIKGDITLALLSQIATHLSPLVCL